MALLAICFPYWLAPLIWGSFSFLVDPWNYRRGGRSILRDVERREWGVLLRLLVAGLLCGALWESCNFAAHQKWIYTVRGLENLKLFEMPLLGFLGFPGLMIDCMAAYGLFAWLFLGNETWEHPADVSHEMRSMPRLPAKRLWAMVPFAVLFWVFTGSQVMRVNIGSVEQWVGDLPGVSWMDVAVLEGEGFSRPVQLLKLRDDHERKEMVRSRLFYSERRFDELLDYAELYHFKGVGFWSAELLITAGVHRVEDLAGWDPAELHTELMRVADEQGLVWRPRLDMVKVWVFGARSRGAVQRVG